MPNKTRKEIKKLIDYFASLSLDEKTNYFWLLTKRYKPSEYGFRRWEDTITNRLIDEYSYRKNFYTNEKLLISDVYYKVLYDIIK